MHSWKKPERLILALGLLAYVLLFIRVAVLYAPDLYLGPSGADRVFYYAYVRSIVIDGDLDFKNEMELCPPSSGLILEGDRPVNKYPIGSPLLSVPFYAATHYALVATAGWHDVSMDGYSRAHAVSYAFGQMVWTVIGFLLLYRILAMFFERPYAAWVTILSLCSTPLIRFVGADLMMSHAASFFALTWSTYEALRVVRSSDDRFGWLRLGFASALVVIVRYQNGVYLLVPGIVALVHVIDEARCRRLGAAALHLGFAALGASAIVILQMIAFKVAGGNWFSIDYSRELSFAWFDPPFTRATALIRLWLPVLFVGVAGSVCLALERREWVVLAVAVSMVLTIYVSMAWWSWEIIARAPFDNAACIAIGIAQVGWAFRRVHPVAAWLFPAAVALINAGPTAALFGLDVGW